MKIPLIFSTCFLLAHAETRIWLSADYEREMEAEFLSMEGDMITINRNGHVLTFNKARLSSEDQEWLAELSRPLPVLPEISSEAFAKSTLGKALLKTKKLRGSAFVDTPLPTVPKLFLLHYSASW